MKTFQTPSIAASLFAVQFFGLIAGFFFAYSVDVMPALDTLTPAAAIEAMRAINIMIRNPIFFAVFFGTPVLGAFAALLLYLAGQYRSAVMTLSATAIYVLAAFLPTAAINVPMNEPLELLALNDPALNHQDIWKQYSPRWTFWNTARTVTSLLALMVASLALVAKQEKLN